MSLSGRGGGSGQTGNPDQGGFGALGGKARNDRKKLQIFGYRNLRHLFASWNQRTPGVKAGQHGRLRAATPQTTADPSTPLRSGRDDKGRAVTFRNGGYLDGRSQERLLCGAWIDRASPDSL